MDKISTVLKGMSELKKEELVDWVNKTAKRIDFDENLDLTMTCDLGELYIYKVVGYDNGTILLQNEYGDEGWYDIDSFNKVELLDLAWSLYLCNVSEE